MMFVAAKDDRTIFLMLTESDLNTMRGGRTAFVDERTTGGQSFKKVILSVHKDKAECLDLLRKSGHKIEEDKLVGPDPSATEGRCTGCQGLMAEYCLLAGKCIACWKESSDHYKQECLTLWGK